MKTNLKPSILFFLDTLIEHGEEAWLVGGCVRDMLMNRPIHDYDITTSATPQRCQHLFEKAGCKVIPTGLKHGTLTIVHEGETVEITTYRIEGAYGNHRSPDAVAFTRSLKEDLQRRDFTMNAIAWHPRLGFRDPFEGRKDIEAGILRCVGDPVERFQEDALRILRAVRFQCTLRFTMEEATLAAIKAQASLLTYVSKERIREEWNRLLMQDYPNTLHLLHELGVLDEILPGYNERMLGYDQHNPWHIYDLFTHTDVALNHTVHYPLASKLAIVFHDIGKPQCQSEDAQGIWHFKKHALVSTDMAMDYMKQLKYDKATMEVVAKRILYHDYYVQPKRHILRKFLLKFDNDVEEACAALDVQAADDAAKNMDRAQEKIDILHAAKALLKQMDAQQDMVSLKTLALNGHDIAALGYQGKAIGEVLDACLHYVVEDPARNEKAQLLAFIKQSKG